jgi:DNA-binding NarL/FixJ family response regulator
MTRTRVALVCDDVFFREGLQQLLRDDPSITIVDEASSASGGAVPSDVVLVDSRRDDALDQCLRIDPDVRPFVILVMVPNDSVAIDAIAAGARGIVRKIDPIQDLVRAVAVVADGSIWAPRDVLVDAWLRHRRGAPTVAQRLSAREYEIVQSVASGMSNKELAAHHGISKATVKAHLTHVFQKLGLTGRGELIATYHGTSVAREREARRSRAASKHGSYYQSHPKSVDPHAN